MRSSDSLLKNPAVILVGHGSKAKGFDRAMRRVARKLRGHYGYYGITGNSYAIGRFRFWVGRVWRRWLNRRSQRARMPWDTFNRLLKAYPLPPARCVHSVYCAR